MTSEEELKITCKQFLKHIGFGWSQRGNWFNVGPVIIRDQQEVNDLLEKIYSLTVEKQE